MCKKALFSVITAVLLMMGLPFSVSASAPARGGLLRVVVDGVLVASGPCGAPYVPLRAVCERLGAVVRWNEVKHEAKVTTAGGDIYTVHGIMADGKLTVKAETVAAMFGLSAKYEPALNTVSLSHGAPPSAAALRNIISNGFPAEDVYWLSRIVEAEARGEDYDSRLAVANVILNRRDSGMYPGTVKDVIFDRKHGIQFTPIANGAVYNKPSSLSLLAALDALDGFNNVPGALFFMNPHQAQTLWIADNRPMAFTVGAHTYYY